MINTMQLAAIYLLETN